MTTQDESDPGATSEVRAIIGDDVIQQLAQAARTHNVMISLHISPGEEPRDPNDE